MRDLTVSVPGPWLGLAWLGLVPVVLVPALCGIVTGRPSLGAALIGGVLALCGLMAIPRRRRAHGSAILSISSLGMLAGLLVDNRSYGPGGLAALCLAHGGDGGVVEIMRHDVATMPALHGMMLLAGAGTSLAIACLARMPGRIPAAGSGLSDTVICNLAMLGGMLLSDQALHRLAQAGMLDRIAWLPARPDLLLAAMPAGMICGMGAGMMLMDRPPGARGCLRVRRDATSADPPMVRS